MPEELCFIMFINMLVRFPNDADQTTSSWGGRSKANEYLPATLAKKSAGSGREFHPGKLRFWTQKAWRFGSDDVPFRLADF